jgi:hypothetical protein
MLFACENLKSFYGTIEKIMITQDCIDIEGTRLCSEISHTRTDLTAWLGWLRIGLVGSRSFPPSYYTEKVSGKRIKKLTISLITKIWRNMARFFKKRENVS